MSSKIPLEYTEKFGRNTSTNFKAKNATTEMNKSAP